MAKTGLKLGLTGKQRRGFTAATRSGTLDQYLGQHKKIGARFEKRAADPRFASRAASYKPYMNNPVKGEDVEALGPAGASAAVPKGLAPGPSTFGTPGGAPGAAAPVPMDFAGFMDTQYGAGNPFGMQDWYGGNPLETASAKANLELEKNLAGIRSRFGAMGMGNSSRAAIAEGTAAGESATGLGDVLAARGIGARADDAGRSLQAVLGAQDMNLRAQQQLMQAGAGLTGIGQEEQQIPNLGSILALLSALQTSQGTGGSRQKGAQGWAFK